MNGPVPCALLAYTEDAHVLAYSMCMGMIQYIHPLSVSLMDSERWLRADKCSNSSKKAGT